MSEFDNVVSSAVPPVSEVSYPIEDEKSPEQKQIELEQAKIDNNLIALNEHPGWLVIRARMERDIENIKTFKDITMNAYTDAELGKQVRVNLMLAEKLTGYLSQVDSAVKAVIDGRQE